MFVLTVDQVGSRTAADLVEPTVGTLIARFGDQLVLGPDRTAGDEFQVLVDSAHTALEVALFLLRDGGWSVGLGIGSVATPLPDSTREARGAAFIAAREAIGRAKAKPSRFQVVAATASAGPRGDAIDDAGATALIDLLLTLRGRRSMEGWEVADLFEADLAQVAMAQRLGITPQAVSLRARAAGVREDRAARPALIAVLASLDGAGGVEHTSA